MRLLGIKITGGFTSEAQVFATLLANRPPALEPLVLYHTGPDDTSGVSQFEAEARTCVTRLDTGWRPANARGEDPLSKAAALLKLRSMLPRLARQASKFAPEVVYSSQQPWDCFTATWLSRRLRIPQVIHLHYVTGGLASINWWHRGPNGEPGRGLRESLVDVISLRSHAPSRLLTCDHVVAISEFIRGDLLANGVRPERVTAIHNSVSIPRTEPGTREAVRMELGIPLDAPVIGIIARVEQWKGQEDTLRAFHLIRDRFPDSRLVIAGSGTYQQTLKELAESLNLQERVIFTGFRRDVARLLASLDVFSHPSRSEPFGLAIAEASAAGLPVVAYAEGAVPEIVEHNVAGLLSAPNDVEDLAQSMASLLGNPERARTMGESGRRRMADRFDPARAGATFAQLLQSVANGGVRPPAGGLSA